MGSISLYEYFSEADLDDWLITSIKALDKPAAELNFVDVRHTFYLVSLKNTRKRRKGCCQSMTNC
jgi:hypothetical protein